MINVLWKPVWLPPQKRVSRRGDRESHVRLRLELEQKDSDFL